MPVPAEGMGCRQLPCPPVTRTRVGHAAAWPPDTVTGTPRAGSGVSRVLLGTVKRSDGTTQVTYKHHPLYYFAGDMSAGTANGQGSTAFGAAWFVVNASGNAVS